MIEAERCRKSRRESNVALFVVAGCWAAMIGCSGSSGGMPASGGSSSGGPDGGGALGGGGPVGGNGATACPAGSLFSTAVGSITAVASDGTSVFFTTSPDPSSSASGVPSTLQSVPVGGGTPTMLATGSAGGVLASLTLDNANVYYLMDQKVRSVPKAGGDSTVVYDPIVLLTIALQWATDDGSIFVGDIDYPARALYRAPKTGGPSSRIFTDPDGLDPVAIGVDSSSIYFMETPPISFEPDAGPRPNYVSSVPKTGGTSTRLATIDVSESYWQLGYTAGTILYSTVTDESSITRIYSLSTAGGAPVRIVDDSGAAPIFAVQNGFVYFETRGSLEKAPIGGGAAVALGATVDYSGTLTLAADSANVYWGQRPGCLLKAAL